MYKWDMLTVYITEADVYKMYTKSQPVIHSGCLSMVLGGKIFSEHELLSLLPRVNKQRYFTQNFIYHQD